ncbi:GRAM domain-containing protein 2B-like isoform X1 [Schistocerca serialis cubense]|uniref:GRAM domain-containing protein 2B-like isoform X1 n=1 Tax=Schistocerca serialis cubense TaxID=2023355 RepID=UPI00214E64AA|nr:GRAM domain-containing protein 2B-like isoform X1 [Schistocerca serialis cubense]
MADAAPPQQLTMPAGSRSPSPSPKSSPRRRPTSSPRNIVRRSGAAAVPPPPPPPPLLVQAPPSSDEDDDLRVLVHSDGSSGCSGQQVAKSAPCTPHGDRDRDRERLAPAASTTCDRDLPSPRTPSHGHSFTRHDRQLKQLSVSAPAMTHHQQAMAAAAAAAAARGSSEQPSVASGSPEPAHSSKYRQKKFHRHFKQVAAEEYVLNYYSCALVGDILLQGHLYITKNYFAFYSNVFGYVTKLLIPTVSVTKISKEKTAYIIPNAVGVSTAEGKHVFGSLLSRDSTHRLMTQVWKAAQQPDPQGNLLPIEQVMKDEVDSASGDVKDDDDSSVSGSDRSCAPSSLECNTNINQPEAGCTKLPNGNLVIGGKHIKLPVKSSPKHAIVGLPRSKWLLIVSTGLLVLLFLSAAFLLYRISKIQSQFTEHPLITTSDEVYQEILKWQSQLHSKSVNEVQEFLSTNLDQLAKVRQSLEALSLLIVSEGEQLQQSQQQSQEPMHSEPAGKQQTPTLPHDKHS